MKGPPLVRIESLDNRHGASSGKKRARYVRFSRRARGKKRRKTKKKVRPIRRCTPPHLISTIYYWQVSSWWISVLARLRAAKDRHLASPGETSSPHPLAIPSGRCTMDRSRYAPVYIDGKKEREIVRAFYRSIEEERFFVSLPRSTQFRPLIGSQEDQTLRQEVKGARTHCWAPSAQTFDSPHERSTHLSTPYRPPPTSGIRFHGALLPFRLPLVAGKASAGNPKKWTVDFRRRGAVPQRNFSARVHTCTCIYGVCDQGGRSIWVICRRDMDTSRWKTEKVHWRDNITYNHVNSAMSGFFATRTRNMMVGIKWCVSSWLRTNDLRYTPQLMPWCHCRG